MITFTASLAPNNAIKIDGTGSSKVVLEMPEPELSEVIKLTLLKGKAFEVIIREADENQNREDIWG